MKPLPSPPRPPQTSTAPAFHGETLTSKKSLASIFLSEQARLRHTGNPSPFGHRLDHDPVLAAHISSKFKP